MRTKSYTVTGVDASAAGIAAAQALTANTPMTLQAAAASLDPPRKITFTEANDVSAVTFTIVGKDRWGNTITEQVTGPNASTVSSKGVYSSITSITPSATSAETPSAGWPVGAYSPWVVCGRSLGNPDVPQVLVAATILEGAPTGNVEVTYDRFPALTDPEITIHDDAAITPGADSVTPGTPAAVRGQGARFALATGAGTSVRVTFTRPGP